MSDDSILRQPHQSDPYGARLVLLVPRPHVKAVKLALERHKRFDRHRGISPEKKDGDQYESTVQDGEKNEQRMQISTTIPHTIEDDAPYGSVDDALTTALLSELHLDSLSPEITISHWNPSQTTEPVLVEHNPLRKAVREALEALPPGTLPTRPSLTVDFLAQSFPDAYSIYKPLLLLPSNSINPIWESLLSEHREQLQPVWTHVARALDCTHIALNSPIPPSNSTSSTHAQDKENILRSPVNLTPIHGDFGPAPTPQSLRAPTAQDFATTLWVHTTQNGIHQTWAPLYTMFSRGNVKEKARILTLPSVTTLDQSNESATAVDLYAGIGYFSFSYARARLNRVLCWELNPWSIEGLRCGAALNKWRARVFTPVDVPVPNAGEAEWDAWRNSVVGGSETFWIFAMSNETADGILRCLRREVPPVRHVNLGLLPVSRLSWPSAVRALDEERGGWIHAHENVGVHELDERKGAVEAEFQRLADEVERGGNDRRRVVVEHVEKVKMYAPGVVHAVFDVHVAGSSQQ
ncbi:S-adenosylmethionine-dependent methyltransferase [Neodidymelliopsis sp. IMI 364377]|nr:S-adenosylmethionine-dependent methyltransferase [Neodidymelliopsis sp. IMI 364377]